MEIIQTEQPVQAPHISLRDAYVIFQLAERQKFRPPDFLLACLADLYKSRKLDFRFFMNRGQAYATLSTDPKELVHRELSNLAVTAIVTRSKTPLNQRNQLEKCIQRYFDREPKCVDLVFSAYQVDAFEEAIKNEYKNSKARVEGNSDYMRVYQLSRRCRTIQSRKDLLNDFAGLQPEVMLRQIEKVRILLAQHENFKVLGRGFASFCLNPLTVMQPFGIDGADLALCLLLGWVRLESQCGEFEIIE